MTPDANFTSSQKGWLLAGTAIGGIAAIGPVPPLISMLGLRLVFSTFGILSGLATALVPMLFSMGGFWALFVIRILQGACLMPAMPAMSQITHHWANSAKREHALFLTLLSLYMQVSWIIMVKFTKSSWASSSQCPSLVGSVNPPGAGVRPITCSACSLCCSSRHFLFSTVILLPNRLSYRAKNRMH